VDHEHATDVKGEVILPGDYVSAKRYPRGTIRGHVIVSKRVKVVDPLTGAESWALQIESDNGTIYDLPSSKSVRKLKRPAVRNAAEPIFVAIVDPAGQERVISCHSFEQCMKVIAKEAARAKPLTYFTIVGDERGKPVQLDRWAVGYDGDLKRVPSRSERKPSVERTTRPLRR